MRDIVSSMTVGLIQFSRRTGSGSKLPNQPAAVIFFCRVRALRLYPSTCKYEESGARNPHELLLLLVLCALLQSWAGARNLVQD
jgi:hypothetical protein